MPPVKSLSAIVVLKQRRLQQRELALADARAAQSHAEHELAQAQAAQQARAAEEDAVRGRLEATTGRGFHGDDVVTLQLLHQDASRAHSEAAQSVTAAAVAQQQAGAATQDAKRQSNRVREQLQRAEERLRLALLAQQAAADACDDEEAEEVAGARLAAARGVRRASRPQGWPATTTKA